MKKIVLLACSFAAAAAVAAPPELRGDGNANGVGFSTVSVAAGSKTILTVPYQTCQTTANSIKLSELISVNGMPGVASADSAESAARVYVLPSGSSDVSASYKTYYCNTSTGWTKYGTTDTEANALSIQAGDGIWLLMPATGSATVFLKGDITSSQSVTVTQGFNLVGAASPDAYNLGSLTFTTPHAGSRATDADKILVPDGQGGYTSYYYKADGWHLHASETVDLSTITIAAGQGFWYYRHDGSDMTITK